MLFFNKFRLDNGPILSARKFDEISLFNLVVILNIEEWADEQALAISTPKSTITLFTPQFAQSNIHP